MMSSQHIRETKIKHASPPSAGWLLSLGLKTVVTHEQSSQTKTCTLCKSLRDSAYSKDTHRGAMISCVYISVFGLFDCLCSLICLFGFLLIVRDSPPPAISLPRYTFVIFNNTAQSPKSTCLHHSSL